MLTIALFHQQQLREMTKVYFHRCEVNPARKPTSLTVFSPTENFLCSILCLPEQSSAKHRHRQALCHQHFPVITILIFCFNISFILIVLYVLCYKSNLLIYIIYIKCFNKIYKSLFMFIHIYSVKYI